MRTRTRILFAGLGAATLAVLTACGNSSTHPSGNNSTAMPGMGGSTAGMPMSASPTGTDTSGMGGMSMPSGNGLADTVNGYALTVHSQPMTGMAMPLTFTITKVGRAVTEFDLEQTKRMHFYLIRYDLSGFQHLHPSMNAAGMWSVTPAALGAGHYRIYTQFLPHADASAGALVLSRPLTIDGSAAPATALPAAGTSTTVDGYTVTLAGALKGGAESPLRITITRGAVPVTDLQPYLDTYAHVTAIHAGDLAFAHLHPDGTATMAGGGPTLMVHADLPEAGTYRVFIQFQTAGIVHTAPITLHAS